MLLLAIARSALACAGFYHEDGASAESDVQRVWFSRSDTDVTVQYEVDLEVDTPTFGWVIPVPGAVTDVFDGDAEAMLALGRATAPILDLVDVSSGGGCGPTAKSGGDELRNDATAGGVEVVYTGSTPTWQVTVLEATSGDALRAWLDENGWSVSGAAFDAYVEEGGWQFVALDLAIDVADELVGTTLPPLGITYDGDRMVFPSRMAQDSDRPSLNTTVFVTGDARAQVAGWGSEDLPLVWDDGEDPDYMQYAALPEAIERIGGDRAFAVTFAGSTSEFGYVTRFETMADRADHDVDAEFSFGGSGDDLQLVVSNQGGCAAPEGAAALLGVPLLVLLRRRRAA
jgi:hypothetical protein